MPAPGSWRWRKFPANGPAPWRGGSCSTRRMCWPSAISARRQRRSSTCCTRRCWAHGSRMMLRLRNGCRNMRSRPRARARRRRAGSTRTNLMRRASRASSPGFSIPRCQANFSDSLQTLAQRLSLLGALNSLSQITLKATMPGVPDFYQGTELWDFSLVDPDNRRPVDFAARARLLETLEEPDWDRLVREWPNGHLKLAWTRQLLKLRTELADVFTDGDYRAVGSDRAASRSFHRIRATTRPRCRDRRGPAMVRCIHRPRPKLAGFGGV